MLIDREGVTEPAEFRDRKTKEVGPSNRAARPILVAGCRAEFCDTLYFAGCHPKIADFG